jgi:hypothetical protein
MLVSAHMWLAASHDAACRREVRSSTYVNYLPDRLPRGASDSGVICTLRGYLG